MPPQFAEEYRPDLIRRAVHALQSAARQAYGSHPEAGLRHSVDVSKRRRDYKTSYGIGISRVARKVHSHRGTRMFWVGSFSPQTRGGRRAHPPKSIKVLEKMINQKENSKAIRSALAATINKELVLARGHKIPAEYPFIVDSSIEKLSKTKEIESVLCALGFQEELARGQERKVRSGRGKSRGRKYNCKKSLLLVVDNSCPLMHAAKNLPGVEIVPVKALNVELLAPGAMTGRVTLWTEKALEVMQKEKLFA